MSRNCTMSMSLTRLLTQSTLHCTRTNWIGNNVPLNLSAQEFIAGEESTWTWSLVGVPAAEGRASTGHNWLRQRRELLGWPHTQARLMGMPQAEAVRRMGKQLDSPHKGGRAGFLGGQGPPWSDHQGLASAAEWSWWEGLRAGYSVQCWLHLPLFCPAPLFLTSSLCSSLRERMGACPAHLLWPRKTHLILGLSHIGGNHRVVAWTGCWKPLIFQWRNPFCLRWSLLLPEMPNHANLQPLLYYEKT